MSAKDAMELLIDPMRKVCRRPSGTDENAMLEIYVDALKFQRREHLASAWEALASHVAGKFWPSADTLLEACRSAEAIANIRQEVLKPTWAEETIMRSDIGQMALSEGWGRDLIDFAAKHGRRPDPDEVNKLRTSAMSANAELEKLTALESPTGWQRRLVDLGNRMMSREQRLRGEYLRLRAAE